ncbi:MAG: VCBS repeat-containing protein [Oscillatoriophycideae cyanobacterium NC_groundwater_1537_Pr4_S-0.65um_50_18]|nr:VCBS repeat-containing protein [Oscillatoriophycideae cyanobacterium NC_groundwater_1537_Pr4_S-0.65um_50_18]
MPQHLTGIHSGQIAAANFVMNLSHQAYILEHSMPSMPGSVALPQSTQTIAFIDANVDSLALLLNGVQPGVEALVLDPQQDGMLQITVALQSRPHICTVHLVAHGSPGCLQLGNTQLSLDTLAHYTSYLQAWFSAALTPQLHLYACNVAAGDAGAEFLSKLHGLTQASIAASAQVVGNAERGGTWQLASHWGTPTPTVAFAPTVLQAYPGVFVSFDPATNLGVSDAPSEVAIGDFNGDGIADLVTANLFSANVSVLLGTGSGSFGAATSFGVGSDPASVAIGDFNGDGIADLVTGNINSANVSVLLGTGTGSFGPATNFAAVPGPFSVTIGDFNGDGKVDLVTANPSANAVSVQLGTGSGSFGAATSFAAGNTPSSLAVGDFNGDGIADIVAANQTSNTVSVLLGTGSGSFGAATSFGVGTNAQGVAIGDFNGDGKADLVTANQSSNTVSVLLGTGSGSFDPAISFGAGVQPSSVAIGDFNGDGRPDLATASTNRDTVSILLNTTPPSNTAPTDLALSATTVDENVAPGTVVGTFSTTDAEGGSFTYALVSGTGADDNGTFTLNGNQLKINVSPNFEADASYSIRVKTTDAGGLSYEEIVTIGVNDLLENTAPTDLALSATTVDENVVPGTIVGTLLTTDAEGGSFTYAFVSGAGDTDNAAFTLDGNQLKINASPNFEADASYSIRVKTTDTEGASYEKSLTIAVNNVNEAPIANPDVLNTSQNAPLSINFSTLLGNDSDPDRDPLSITNLSAGNGGTISIINSGSLLFTPTSDFTGAASFNYTVSDGGLIDIGKVTVNVASVAGINRNGGNGRDTLNGGLGRDTLNGGNGDDILNGGAGGDTLLGGNGNDTLVGGAGGDLLTGDNGSDTFRFALSDSLLANFDRITDLQIGTDIIDGPTTVSAANVAELGAVTSLTQAGLSGVLTGGSFGANQAATFSFGDRTFLALNNGSAGFQAASDGVIEITGYSGSLVNLAIA